MKTIQKPIMLTLATLFSAFAFGQLGAVVNSTTQAAVNATANTAAVASAATSASVAASQATSAATNAATSASVAASHSASVAAQTTVNAASQAAAATTNAAKATIGVTMNKVADVKVTTMTTANTTGNQAVEVAAKLKNDVKKSADVNAGVGASGQVGAGVGIQGQSGNNTVQAGLNSSTSVDVNGNVEVKGSKLIEKTEATAASVAAKAENKTEAAIQTAKNVKANVTCVSSFAPRVRRSSLIDFFTVLNSSSLKVMKSKFLPNSSSCKSITISLFSSIPFAVIHIEGVL